MARKSVAQVVLERFEDKKKSKKSEEVIEVTVKPDKKGDTTKTSSYSTTYKYAYTKKEITDNVDPNAELLKEKGFKYNVVEVPKGVSFLIKYKKDREDFDIDFQHKEEEQNEENHMDFYTLDGNINGKDMPLKEPFSKLKDMLGFGFVDFIVFAEYITQENQKVKYFKEKKDWGILVIKDIYINGNWIRQKDLEKICKEVGLITMPILYEGIHDEKIFDVFVNETGSHFNPEVEKYGIYIKSVMEMENKGKRMVKLLLNEKFKEEKSLSLFFNEEELRKKAAEFLTEKLDDTRFEAIDKILKFKYPNFLEDKELDVGKFLSDAVSTVKLYHLYGWREKLGGTNFTTTDYERKIEKVLNSLISAILIKRYGLMNRRVNAN